MSQGTPNPQVGQFAHLIRLFLPHFGSIDAAVNNIRTTVPLLLSSPDAAIDLAEAAKLVREEFENIQVLRKHSIIRVRPKWYTGPRTEDRHWPALATFLIEAKGWSVGAVSSIDETSSEVVSLLDNPLVEGFACRGLVVGYVQSGKTANMTAVIAKAVDAGYNLVIILAGLTDKLRQQTQRRLQSDLINRWPDAWFRLTTEDIKGDFRQPAHKALTNPVNRAQIAVVKKNVGPLKQLQATIEATSKVVLGGLRALIIDDECDQASVNAASGEFDMTSINARIRELLAALPAVSYVGYTATPFANVLISPYRPDGVELDDLYPRDFISSLPLPAGYFGPERLFGRLPLHAEDEVPEEEGLDMIREVPEEDEAKLQPPSRAMREKFQPEMPPSLEDAILWFIACCAVRCARGDSESHMTMLVHTSAFVVVHDRLATLIRGWIDSIKGDLLQRRSAIGQRLCALWEYESGRLPPDISESPRVEIEQIFQHLPQVLARLETPVENGVSVDRIDYSNGPKTYVVVGGSVLARGLTLEGLMVSYFLRSANQYDTLLQMGRWFGYRGGYEDLPRIWMPDPLRVQFRALAGIEAEIRDDIAEYALRKVTPMEFAVRIRSIPGMAITAANKMRAARPCDISYWGQHVQTIRFDHRDERIVAANWQAGADLVSAALQQGRRRDDEGKLLFTRVPKASVVRFLRTYVVNASHRELSREALLGFVESTGTGLEYWNVGVFQPGGGDLSSEPLGRVGKVRLVRRSKLKDPPEDLADIKALMSRSDVLFDCEEKPEISEDNPSWSRLKEVRAAAVGDTPLLLLYAIDHASPAKPGSRTRAGLDAVGDLLGFGLVFPGPAEGAGTYYSVVLSQPSADEADELDVTEEEERELLVSSSAN